MALDWCLQNKYNNNVGILWITIVSTEQLPSIINSNHR